MPSASLTYLLKYTEPSLSQEAKAVVKSYGSWTAFCHAYGYKPWDSSDEKDAARLAESFGKEEKEKENK
jgi:Tat protein secretion system quality control protein TatD with DNase activity